MSFHDSIASYLVYRTTPGTPTGERVFLAQYGANQYPSALAHAREVRREYASTGFYAVVDVRYLDGTQGTL